MIKKALALLLAVAALAGCGQGAAPASSSTEPVVMEVETGGDFRPRQIDEVAKNSVMQFARIKSRLFEMQYEARSGSAMPAVFGMDFPEPCDTNWLSPDEGLTARYDLSEYGTDVYGYVTVTTAPADPAAHYGLSAKKDIQSRLEADFLKVDAFYEKLRGEASGKGHEVVMEGMGIAFPTLTQWTACYVEYKDSESGNRSMRLYLSNNDISEKFYSMLIEVDIPEDQTERIDRFRSIIFSLHPVT